MEIRKNDTPARFTGNAMFRWFVLMDDGSKVYCETLEDARDVVRAKRHELNTKD